jgi:hypothetical protein
MTRRLTKTRWLAVVALGLVAACSRGTSDQAGADNATPNDSAAAAAPASGQSGVGAGMTGDTRLMVAPGGTFITDSRGRAVFILESADGTPVTDCTGECAAVFEPVTGTAMVASGDMTVQSSMIGTTTIGGRQVVTYNGKALYFLRDPSGQPPTTGTIRASRISGSGMKVEGQ